MSQEEPSCWALNQEPHSQEFSPTRSLLNQVAYVGTGGAGAGGGHNGRAWTLTSLQTRLIKTGGRLVRHARRLVFQLAEVLVTREMLTGILERISRLRLAPG